METARPDVLIVAAVLVHVFLQRIPRNVIRKRHARDVGGRLGLRDAGNGDHVVVLAREEIVHSMCWCCVDNACSRVFGDVIPADDHMVSEGEGDKKRQRVEERMLVAASLERESREAVEQNLEGGVEERLQRRNLMLHDNERSG